MGKYLIDNNIISSYFSGLFSDKAMDFVAKVIDQTPNISVITEIEALSWISPDKSKEAIVKSFIEDANIMSLTRCGCSIGQNKTNQENKNPRCNICSNCNYSQSYSSHK